MNFYQFYKLLNEYGETLVQTLIDKFKKEEPALTPDIIKRYIDRFERIKNNLPEKDITRYNWSDLESAVDGYQSKERIKAGKIDPTVSDANLLLNKDGIRIYLGKDKKSCVKYSNGYTFCIGARGEDNMYGYYRFNRKGTPYFIFNDNMPSTDKRHLIVLFAFDEGKDGVSYTVTLSDNQKEHKYPAIEHIISDFPWISGLLPFLNLNKKGIVKPPTVEHIEHILKDYLQSIENDFHLLYDSLNEEEHNATRSLKREIESGNKQKVLDFLDKKNNIELCYVRMYPIVNKETKWEPLLIPIKYLDREKTRLDSPSYFSFFTSNSKETINKIKEKFKYFIETFGLNKEDHEEMIKELNKKQNIIQELLEKNKGIKPYLYNLHSIFSSFSTSGDSIPIPYMVIQVNNIRETGRKVILENMEYINHFFERKSNYVKVNSFVRSLKEEELKKVELIIKIAEDKYPNISGTTKAVVDTINYFMNHEEGLNAKPFTNESIETLINPSSQQEKIKFWEFRQQILSLFNKLQGKDWFKLI